MFTWIANICQADTLSFEIQDKSNRLIYSLKYLVHKYSFYDIQTISICDLSTLRYHRSQVHLKHCIVVTNPSPPFCHFHIIYYLYIISHHNIYIEPLVYTTSIHIRITIITANISLDTITDYTYVAVTCLRFHICILETILSNQQV